MISNNKMGLTDKNIFVTAHMSGSIERFTNKIDWLVSLGFSSFRFNMGKCFTITKSLDFVEYICLVKSKYPDISVMIDFPYPKSKIRLDLGMEYLDVKKDCEYFLVGKCDLKNMDNNANIITINSPVSQNGANKYIIYGDGECIFEVIQNEGEKSYYTVKAQNDFRICNGKSLTAGFQSQGSEYLAFVKQAIIDIEPDFVAFSFIESKYDASSIEMFLNSFSNDVELMFKIETEEGIRNIGEIIEHGDSIMIARGDLGLYSDVCKLYFTQKELLYKALKKGKKVYFATGILSSLVKDNIPSRSDIIDLTSILIMHPDGIILNHDLVFHQKIEQAKQIIERTLSYIDENS
jgi:pyruvate kinase